jgi:hypothetical protein
MRFRLAALILALPLLAAGCGGGKCDECSDNADCDQSKGYVCELYEDGIRRCGDPRRPFDECRVD